MRQSTNKSFAFNAPKKEEKRVFNEKEAAQYLGVSVLTLRKWRKAGAVRCIQVEGGAPFYSRVVLETFLLYGNMNNLNATDAAQA